MVYFAAEAKTKEELELKENSKEFKEDEDSTKRLIENLIECLNTRSHQEVLVMESSNKTLESCGFKTNFLCMNADFNEEDSDSMLS
jgi:hypothetical protein